ncbi:ABC transporter permease [Arachidicoccus ginsenosidivorans]|uniref:FtsX-like permease family protein n=1 Tax=Arachidicoccus ginsenosidivorans TaxID=496057 RepID=A0A5B8VPE3_9BACT|nr:ABC transporter permease [Arachidicoccus ginsenosidivorans]QEC72455.1 FtsX-like permease family protein [Arachidicoccus ginsenosidivorans]
MLLNYFKTAWRRLKNNKFFSIINILGLAIGISCAAMIFLWVENELHWDDFNTKKDQLYFVRENQKYNTYTTTFSSTPGLLGPAIQKEIPGIANTCRTSEGSKQLLFTIGDKSMYASGIYAEPSLFNMFTLPFVQGSGANAFSELHSIVITEKTAKKFFGSEKDKAIGKTVRVDGKTDYVITGVLKDIPQNASLNFEWVAPFKIFFQSNPYLHRWGNSSLSTYVELKPGVSAAAVNKRLYNFIQQRDPTSIARPFLFSMNDWHLRDQFDNGVQTGGGRIEYIRLFTIIAAIILLIACINFMNLSTARSEKRAKEVGVRKTLGAFRRNLIFNFIGEAVLMAFLAALTAVVIVFLTLPAFNLLVEKHLSLGLSNPIHIVVLLIITLICGLAAGSYPALYLSSFDPVEVLKGLKSKTKSVEWIRKGLVVLQFTASIILIICTIIVYQQIQRVKSRNLGFNKSNLLQIDVQGDVAKNYDAIKQDLLASGYFENVALSDHQTIYSGNNTGSLMWKGKTTEAQILISQRYVSKDFFNTSGIKLLEGRDLAAKDSAVVNKTIGIVITQSLEKLMGSGSALGKKIWDQGDTSGIAAQVVGVVHDYVYGDMYGKSDPVIFYYGRPASALFMYARLKSRADLTKSLAFMQSVMKRYNPEYPFKYQFVDDQFNQMLLGERLISKLSRVFAALAIVISCLGLFGLAAFTAERRIKEIGIRKVFGASVRGIALLLSKDFLKLIAIACLIAFPIAGLVMRSWLQNYQYRVEIKWWTFLVAGVSAILIALVTIGFQTVKAARANPVRSLKSE